LFFTFKYLCLGIGAGLESMTTNPMAWDGSVNPRVIFPFFLTLTPLPDYLIHSIFYFWFLEIIPLKGYKVVICLTLSSQVKMFEQAQNCLLPMGITSENVAGRFGVSRKEQDEAAVSWIYILMQHYLLSFIYNLTFFYINIYILTFNKL
jgi:acetyl-CoA acyltransferase 1